MKSKTLYTCLIVLVASTANAQSTLTAPANAVGSVQISNGTRIPLWEQGAPGFEDRRNEPEKAESYWVAGIHNPSITVYLPPPGKANGTAVLIAPGGGHRELGFKGEGVEPAEFFNKLGVAGFALKYRLGNDKTIDGPKPYSVDIHARQDGHRAMRLIRSHAEKWSIDPDRIGIMGFSAGGQLASMVVYDSHDGNSTSDDPVERVSSKVDFQIQIYPGGGVRGTDAAGMVGPDLTHVGSRLSVGAGILPNNANDFMRWLTHNHTIKPEVLMPSFRMLPKEDLTALAAYLDGLQ